MAFLHGVFGSCICTPDQEIIPTCIGIASQYTPFHHEFSYSLIKRSVKPLVIVLAGRLAPQSMGLPLQYTAKK
jgi:hypothetical protein